MNTFNFVTSHDFNSRALIYKREDGSQVDSLNKQANEDLSTYKNQSVKIPSSKDDQISLAEGAFKLASTIQKIYKKYNEAAKNLGQVAGLMSKIAFDIWNKVKQEEYKLTIDDLGDDSRAFLDAATNTN